MKLLLTTIAAVVLVGCGESQQSSTPVEAELVEPVAEVPSQQSVPAPEGTPVEPVAEVPAQPSSPQVEAELTEPVAEAAKPEQPTAKAPDISILDAAKGGDIEAVK